MNGLAAGCQVGFQPSMRKQGVFDLGRPSSTVIKVYCLDEVEEVVWGSKLPNTLSKTEASALVRWEAFCCELAQRSLKRQPMWMEIYAHILAADRALDAMVMFYPFNGNGIELYKTLKTIMLEVANTGTMINNKFDNKSYSIVHLREDRDFFFTHANRFSYGLPSILITA